MELLAWICAIALAAVFGVAAVAKFRDPAGTRTAIRDFGFDGKVASDLGSSLLPLAEAITASLLMIPATSVVGAWASLFLLVTFVVAISMSLIRGRRPDCHCFGQVHSAPIGPATIVRNGVLACLVIPVILAEGGSPSEALSWWVQASTIERAFAAIAVVGSVALGTLGWLVARLTREVAALRAQVEPVTALEIGEAAPIFGLANLDGSIVQVGSPSEDCKPSLVVFTSTDCVVCREVLPDLAKWQNAYAAAVQTLVVSTGSAEEIAAEADRYGLTSLLLDEGGRTQDAYRIQGTPSAVLVQDGKVGSLVAAGPEAIRALFDEQISRHVSSLWRQATGEDVALAKPPIELGAPLPDTLLANLDGRPTVLDARAEQGTVVLLWSPHCPFCADMLDDLKRLEVTRTAPRLVFVSEGTPSDNRAQDLRSQILLDEGFSFGRSIGATGTPSALAVDQEGRVSAHLAVGEEEILKLVEAKRIGNV